jgi:hypothetical protein
MGIVYMNPDMGFIDGKKTFTADDLNRPDFDYKAPHTHRKGY